MIVNIFSYSVGCIFTLLIMSFDTWSKINFSFSAMKNGATNLCHEDEMKQRNTLDQRYSTEQLSTHGVLRSDHLSFNLYSYQLSDLAQVL